MSALIVTFGAFFIVFGCFLAIFSYRLSLPQPRRRFSRIKLRRRDLLVIGLAILVFVFTSWWPSLVLIPALGILLPILLGDPPNREIELLEALDRWLRLLTASIATGKSVPDAMRATFSQSPKLLEPQISLLLTRLNNRWTMREALYAMADDLDSADADAAIAALILLSQRGGIGARISLATLSQNVSDRLQAMRELDAERAKPRVVVRQVTLITLLMIVGTALLNRHYFAPFFTPIGQVIAIGLIAAYFASLAILHKMSLPRKRERILNRDASYV